MAVKVTVNSVSPNRISINNQQRTTIRTVGVAGPEVVNQITQLSQLTDVDATDPDNNETLVYDETLQKYVIKILPNINGGTF
jgi:hypothetical protein